MRTHRIKQVNLPLVTKGLTDQSIPFQVVAAPVSDTTYYQCDGWYDDDAERIAADISGMVGIQCSMSGKKFHKLLVSLGVVS